MAYDEESELPEETVVQITDYFATANPVQRQVLVDLFGAQGFLPLGITNEVKTFGNACTKLGITEATINAISITAGVANTSALAFIKLAIICKALNGGWVADLTNTTQIKHLPQPTMVGGVLNYSATTYVITTTTAPMALMLKSAALTQYLCTQFASLLTDYYSLSS